MRSHRRAAPPRVVGPRQANVSMYTLWYHTTCPLARQAKAVMDAMEIAHQVRVAEYWDAGSELFDICELGMLPVLCKQGFAIEGIYPVLEYLFSTGDTHLFSRAARTLCEARRLFCLINERFYLAVSRVVVREKFIRLVQNDGSPSREALRAAIHKEGDYLEYFSCLIKDRNFLACDTMTAVDIALASHLSVLDYFGTVEWYRYPILKEWYQVVKSLPYFRTLLCEKISAFSPPAHYTELDF